jgi:DNA repair exonuclease SbcCD ATPase subunit
MAGVIEQLSQDITSINTEQSDLIKKKEAVSEEISGKSFLEEKQKDSNSKRMALNGRKQTLTSQNIENESLLAIAEDASRNIERNKADIEKLKQDLSSAKKDGESLKLIKEAFSPNGIKAIVIDYVIPQLEEKINEILSKLSDFRVILETQKTGAKEETILEGLFITVVNELGEHLDFQSFSGGEKIKISLSINEALAEISKINFRFFDETVVALDNESVQQFLEAMNNIQEKVSQVLCISHMQEIKDSFDEKITVIKNNGNSIIK